jgi:hypothetical protein
MYSTKTPTCSNCGKQHSAAYKECPTFLKSKQNLAYAVKHGISYRDAVKAKANKSELTQSTPTTFHTSTTAIIKADSSTQTDVSQETETDSKQVINADITKFLRATADTISWLLTQIKVPDSLKGLLSKLKSQHDALCTVFFDEETQIKKQEGNSNNILPQKSKPLPQHNPTGVNDLKETTSKQLEDSHTPLPQRGKQSGQQNPAGAKNKSTHK